MKAIYGTTTKQGKKWNNIYLDTAKYALNEFNDLNPTN